MYEQALQRDFIRKIESEMSVIKRKIDELQKALQEIKTILNKK